MGAVAPGIHPLLGRRDRDDRSPAALLNAGEYRRLRTAVRRLRLLLPFAAAGAAFAIPDLRDRWLFVVAMVGLYLPYALVVERATDRLFGTRAAVLLPVGEIGVLFGFQALVPPTRVGVLFAYVLVAGYATYVHGWRVGTVAAALAAALMTFAVGVLGWERMSAFDAALLVSGVIAAVSLGHAAAGAQRRSTLRLMVLYDAVRATNIEQSLQSMLDTIRSSAMRTFEARSVAVRLRRSVLAPLPNDLDPETNGGFEDLSEAALQARNPAPWARALVSRRPVIVEDIRYDPRFIDWEPTATVLGIRSLVVEPLVIGGEPIAVLSIAFGEPRHFDDDLLEFGRVYADQAACALFRSLEFERQRVVADQLRSLDRSRRQFLASVTHDLRSPVTTIQGFSQTLLARWDMLSEDSRREMVQRVARRSEDLLGLVDQVLSLGRGAPLTTSLRRERLRVLDAVGEAVDSLGQEIGRHQVVVSCPRRTEVDADADALQRILVNLLSNASKYTPAGSRIRIEAVESGGEAVVSVSDDGPGIAPDELDHVFEDYFRGGAAESDITGTGLGLGIVQRLVDLLGGRIWAESEPGQGARFAFTLPLAVSPAETQQRLEQAAR